MNQKGDGAIADTPAGSKIWGAILVIVMLVIIGAALFPMFARCRICGTPPSCQSNMKQIGNSIKMYLSDWDNTYPTNRPYLASHKLGPIRPYARLSPPDPIGTETEPRRFRHSVNWVEGLYNYVETITRSSDPQSVWRCDNASSRVFPEQSKFAAVNYVFNRNLVELREGRISCAANLMMLREIDAVVDAELRPTNDTTWTSKVPPISPFLTDQDARLERTNPKLHGNGSHILFADGHVKILSTEAFPTQDRITRARCWDPKTRQWYNHAPSSGAPAYLAGSIAITP